MQIRETRKHLFTPATKEIIRLVKVIQGSQVKTEQSTVDTKSPLEERLFAPFFILTFPTSEVYAE